MIDTKDARREGKRLFLVGQALDTLKAMYWNLYHEAPPALDVWTANRERKQRYKSELIDAIIDKELGQAR